MGHYAALQAALSARCGARCLRFTRCGYNAAKAADDARRADNAAKPQTTRAPKARSHAITNRMHTALSGQAPWSSAEARSCGWISSRSIGLKPRLAK